MNVLIVGASGGIGSALLSLMLTQLGDINVIATHHSQLPKHGVNSTDDRVHWVQCDVSCAKNIEKLASVVERKLAPLNWCVNTVGMLHQGETMPEKTIRRFDSDFFIENIQRNTLPTLELAKQLNALFDKHATAIFATVSAKVGSIQDNRLGGWYSYRCSKAALNMALKTLSLEWRKTAANRCVAALHPGTVCTELSAPFTRRTPKEKLFTPQQSAQYLYTILCSLRPEDSGTFWSWDGSQLPW